MTKSREQLIREEFPQLAETLYLDYAGGLPTCQSQVKELQAITNQVFVTPHSAGKPDLASMKVESLRATLCNALGTDQSEYWVVFTQNTTTAIQLIGNLIKYDDFHYFIDNHNSILGMAEIARRQKVKVQCVNDIPKQKGMFVYPMMSNFSGQYYPMEWISEYQKLGGIVMLDAASSACPDLSVQKPDFVFLSLFKLTGAHGGAVLVKRGREDLLSPPPPAGGTVLFSCARSGQFKLLPFLHQRLEGGTISFNDLALALEGFHVRRKFGTEKQIREHVKMLTERLHKGMKELKHSNGKQVVHFVPENRDESFGPNISFNLFRADDVMISHQDAQLICNVNKIVGRFGGHCNPGAGFPNLGWEEDEIAEMAEENEKRGRCISNLCVLGGKPVGTIRFSLGYPNTVEDVDKLIGYLKQYFVDGGPDPKLTPIEIPMTVKKFFIFPLAGALGFEVNKWELDDAGLKYDRHWRVITSEGEIISTTTCIELSSIEAKIEGEQLVLTSFDERFTAPFEFQGDDSAPAVVKKHGSVYGKEASEFLFKVTGRWLYLVKSGQRESFRFAFSAATEESIATLPPGFDQRRLRVNLILSGAPAFHEEGPVGKKLALDGIPIKVWRWRIICMTTSVVPFTKDIDVAPMKVMADLRSHSGVVPFGVLFGCDCAGKTHQIAVGAKLAPIE